MKSLYWGATQSLAGATFLNTKAIVNVKEGYQIGSSNEYVEIGDFEVDNFEIGSIRQTLALTLSSPLRRLNQNVSVMGRNYRGTDVFIDRFDDPGDTLRQNYSAQYKGGSFLELNAMNIWGVSANALRCNDPETAGRGSLLYNKSKDMKDVSVQAKFLTSNGTKYNDWGLAVRWDQKEQGDYGLVFAWTFPSNGQLILTNVTGGSIDDLAGSATGISLLDNTPYWFRLRVKDNKAIGSYSTDGRNFTTAIDYTIPASEYIYTTGKVGIRVGNANNPYEMTIDDFEFCEFGIEDKTYEDITKRTLALGSVFGSTVQSELHDVSQMEAKTGSSWVSGVTNGVVQVDHYNTTGADGLFDTFTTIGATYNDFVFDCEMKITGNSALAGIVVGSSDAFYQSTYGLVASNTIGPVFSGSTYLNYGGKGWNWTLKHAEQWYKLRLIKQDTLIRFYLNGTLANYIYGASWKHLNGASVTVGLGVDRRTITGQQVSYRGMRISALDNLAKDADVDPNAPIDSVFRRYIPDGYATNWHKDQVDIFQVGASRGVQGISARIIDSTESLDNVVGDKYAMIRSDSFEAKTYNTNSRVTDQLDSMRARFVNDQNATAESGMKKLTNQAIVSGNRNIQPVNVDINVLPHLEKYDRIDLVDSILGVSLNMLLMNNTKSYDANNGSFRQTLLLQKNGD